MDKQHIRNALAAALDDLVKHDEYLMRTDASERSISHRLAVHLASRFQGYHVDCEFNRDGFDIKRLPLRPRKTTSHNINAVTVFPDVIVHLRGCSTHNLLVIEVKKMGCPNKELDYDAQKLKAFMSEMEYWCAAHVEVGFNNGPKAEASWLQD